MSRVLSLRFKDEQVVRLERLARRLGRTPSETAARLVEEALRISEYAFIDFRDSPVGRQAYVTGSGLAVWEVAMIARAYGWDADKAARHLNWPLVRVKAALHYAADFRAEIDAALADNDAYDFARLSRLLPRAEQFFIDDDATDPRQ